MTSFGVVFDRAFAWPQQVIRRLAGVALPARLPSQALAERIRLLSLARSAPATLLAPLLLGQMVAAASPAALALAIGHLVGVLTSAPSPQTRVVAGVVLLAAALLAQQVGQLTIESFGLVAAREIDRKVRLQVRQVALAPADLRQITDQTYQDELRRASDQGISWRVRSPGTAATGQVTLLFRLIAVGAAALLIARFSIALAVLLVVMALLMRAIIRTQWMELTAVEDRFARRKRQASYLMDLSASRAAAKEVRVFRLGDWLADRRHNADLGWIRQLWRMKNTTYGRQGWLALLALGAGGLALLVPGLAAARGAIGVDDLAVYVSAAWAVFAITFIGFEAFDIEHGIGAVHALDRLRATGPPDPRYPDGPRPCSPTAAMPPAVAPRVTLSGVEFGYPHSDVRVLTGIDLEIRPGEVLAIVGSNGTGKTTLIKLLTGLHDPTRGTIRIDGEDLKSLELRRWRRQLSVLFQDFVRYPLTLEQNVALGAGDHELDPELVRQALRDAGAEELTEDLPQGMATSLTRTRRDGVELSGGQWQKLALARVRYAVRQGARIVVLDEPTAHLDVLAEARFFDEVISTAEGVTVILISHRMSTVRRADRIILLEDGRITETGTHDMLIAANGEYARLFQLQAARFRAGQGKEVSP